MSYNLLWIFLLIPQPFTSSYPLPNGYDLGVIGIDRAPMDNSPKIPKYEDLPGSSDEKVISVRITSSVAVGRGRGKTVVRQPDYLTDYNLNNPSLKSPPSKILNTTVISRNEDNIPKDVTDVPPNLVGANIEYIRQLNAKKESREHSAEPLHSYKLMTKSQQDSEDEKESLIKIDEYEPDVPLARKVASAPDANRFQEQKANKMYLNQPFKLYDQNHHSNVTNETFIEPVLKFSMNAEDNKPIGYLNTSLILGQKLDKKETRDIDRLTSIDPFNTNSNNYQTDDSVAESSIKSVEFAKYNERLEDILPTATMPSEHLLENIQGLSKRPLNGARSNPRLTTVSFNVVHDSPKAANDNEPSNSYITSSQIIPNRPSFYDSPKIYSEPAKIYSEPAKFYSEPAKIYSEPAKIYSEPAKVYSEPAKIYSEPSKFYSEPASLHLNHNVPPSMAPNYSPWQGGMQQPVSSTTAANSVHDPHTTQMEHQPEKNYEVDEKESVLTDGRSHGVQVQETSTEKCKQDNCKVGYVVEGRQFKKYRVEERTSDGFIVGEYGVVRNEDGALRGVRYTADSDASPRLIHDALMKFLQLK